LFHNRPPFLSPSADKHPRGATCKPNFCDTLRGPDPRSFETTQVFQFCDGTAKIKSAANAVFLCFRWKTSHFVKDCGGWDTVHL
jgi:hypothetical protein